MSNHITIQDRYAEQFAADLESNTKEQEAVRVQMAELQARLDELEKAHVWLSTALDTLSEKPLAPKPSAPASGGSGDATPAEPAASAVPRPRQAKPKKAADKAGGSRKKPAQPQPGGKAKAPKAGAKKSDGPTLRELVLDVLVQHHQPRMVGEVVQELTQAHPQRPASSGPVVRNALEALVAKSAVERERKQGSVFYTAATAAKAAEEKPAAAV